MKRLFVCLLLLMVSTSTLFAAVIPRLTSRVTDAAHLLSAETTNRLTDLLKQHEQQTGNQIAVLTVSSLDGESIEGYATRVFESWKLGQQHKDNGVLLIVVPKDRMMRIEVGYGLEGTLTDLTSGRIIRNVMAPRFKEENYDAGVTDGVEAIVQVLNGGALPEAAADKNKADSAEFSLQTASLPVRILVGLFVFGILGVFSTIGIITPGGTGWFLYVFLIPFWVIFPFFLFGLTALLVCAGSHLLLYPIIKLLVGRTGWHRQIKQDLKSNGKASVFGFTFHARGSGGSSSSSSSGSSFSGGGGSSDGGGASGSW
jgi:uncharacterized protein